MQNHDAVGAAADAVEHVDAKRVESVADAVGTVAAGGRRVGIVDRRQHHGKDEIRQRVGAAGKVKLLALLRAFEAQHDVVDRKHRHEFRIEIVARHQEFGGETAVVSAKAPGKAGAGIAAKQPAAFGRKHHAMAGALRGREREFVEALQHVVRPIQ